MAGEPVKVVTDASGRSLSTKSLDLLEELDLIEVAGPASDNKRWMQIATLCATVRAIDGTPQIWPVDRKSLRAAIAKVGSDGLVAVIKALNVEIVAETAAATDLDTAKN